jgi:hypothetical protein
MKRRKFLKYGAGSLLATPLILNRYPALYANTYASPIVSVIDKLASKVEYQSGKIANSDGVIVDKILSYEIINTRVAKMVDSAIMKITNKSNLGEAWESLFPPGHPNMNTKIGIKLNFSYGDWRDDLENDWSRIYCPFGPKAAVTNAIILGLCQMLDGTFPIENITLVERMYVVGRRQFYPVVQGYRPVLPNDEGLYKDQRPGACSIHWIYSSNPLELPVDAPGFIAAPDFTGEYQAPQRIYSAIYQNDFLINYAIAKDHRAAGITGAMKNNYGCTNNPLGTHGNQWKNDNSPYAGTRLCIPVFQKNVHLHSPYIIHILDALTGVHNGGPLSGNVFQANTLAVSKDPVALDSYQLNLINQARLNNRLPVIQTDDGRTQDGHPNAAFLRIATERDELGSMSQENLQSFDLSNDDEQYVVPATQKGHALLGNVRNSKDSCELPVFLDNSNRAHSIESRIEDVRGKVIRSFQSLSTKSAVTTLQWDYRTDDEKTVNEGYYIWYVSVNGILHSSTINTNF